MKNNAYNLFIGIDLVETGIGGTPVKFRLPADRCYPRKREDFDWTHCSEFPCFIAPELSDKYNPDYDDSYFWVAFLTGYELKRENRRDIIEFTCTTLFKAPYQAFRQVAVGEVLGIDYKGYGYLHHTHWNIIQIDLFAALNKVGILPGIVYSENVLPSDSSAPEPGLSSLIGEAFRLQTTGQLQLSLEKIWDAFERVKTVFNPSSSKSQSIEALISAMSAKIPSLKNHITAEFRELTTIGNDFRIRHSEVTKPEIVNDRLRIYLFKRCAALVSAAIPFLPEHQ